MKQLIKELFGALGIEILWKKNLPFYFQQKYKAEINFWKNEMNRYIAWYMGELKELYEEPSPLERDKVQAASVAHRAILTWQKAHQYKKYIEDLGLSPSAFEGMTVLDIGSGPHPSALAFSNSIIYCLDPLLPRYLEAGFPIHIYEPRAKFVYGFSERMPFPDDFFDAIISVNALDHVDDFSQTAQEIRRVLKPSGKLRFHLHFHPATITEPLELNDEVVLKSFEWCAGFHKISETNQKRGTRLVSPDESYSVWSNF